MKNVFELVAAENGVSEAEVYQEIQDAIRTAMESDDSVKEKWKAIFMRLVWAALNGYTDREI